MKTLMAMLRKKKKMNKGGECYSEGGVVEDTLDPTFEDGFGIDELELDDDEDDTKKDKMSFVRSYFAHKALRRR